MSKNKIFILSFICIAVFSITFGITVAFFNYTRTGEDNTIKVGRIAFVSRQTKTINIRNLYPIDPTETGIMDDTTKVGTFEVEIEGDTDYSEGIEYLISSVNTNLVTNEGNTIPVSLDIDVTNLGASNTDYWNKRNDKDATIYKRIVGGTLVGDQMLLVGYIKPNTVTGTKEGVNGKIIIKAYLDENKIGVSDTYDGTESDNMGTTNEWAEGRMVYTTSEWNALKTQGLSFQIKVEANEGIWVKESLEEIMKTENLNKTTKLPTMDNVASEFVSASTGINFGEVSSDTNGKGVYMRAGTENDDYPIWYYRGNITNNNVIFNNKCWKAVRTTDTGGVKLIYNGESSELYGVKTLSEIDYNKNTANSDSRWLFNSIDNTWNIEINDNSQPAIEFTVPSGDDYIAYIIGTSGSNCGGCYALYKNGTSLIGDCKGGGSAMNITHDLETLSSTDVIKMNYSGSSSDTCTISFKIKMTSRGEMINANICNKTGTDSQINYTEFNTEYRSPANVGYMYGDIYLINLDSTTSGAYYGSGFTYTNGEYKLTNPSTTKDNNHHYTCNLTTADGTCETIRYYFYNNYYVNLTSGDSIEKAIEKMQTNSTDSNIKMQIDSWYVSNMNMVTNKLEDTVWCNDRSIGNGNNGWIAYGGDLNTPLYYGAYQRSSVASNTSIVKNQPTLVCANKNDAFTVGNSIGNGKLTYPIALLTEDEMVLAGGAGVRDSIFYLNNGDIFWSLSPNYFDTRARVFHVYKDGSLYEYPNYWVERAFGLRPAISIKPGLPIISGDGTATNPYVIS